jgi:predicted nucleic acid-binding protein
MRLLVVDASVVIKWFVPEDYDSDALRLRDSSDECVVPDLLFAEVSNVMWMKVRRGVLSEDEAMRAIDDLKLMKLATVSCHDLANGALSLSMATGRSAYDSMYLALALRLKTRLITADMKFLKAIKSHPLLAPHISFIADS